MECQYKFKSGSKKNQMCLKEKCKTKAHNKEPVKKEPAEAKEICLLGYAKMMINEVQFLFDNNLKINVLNIQEGVETFEKKAFEELDTPREVQYYILYRFKKLNNHDLTEVKRVILPMNKYEELDDFLLGKEKFDFLASFTDIKLTL